MVLDTIAWLVMDGDVPLFCKYRVHVWIGVEWRHELIA